MQRTGRIALLGIETQKYPILLRNWEHLRYASNRNIAATDRYANKITRVGIAWDQTSEIRHTNNAFLTRSHFTGSCLGFAGVDCRMFCGGHKNRPWRLPIRSTSTSCIGEANADLTIRDRSITPAEIVFRTPRARLTRQLQVTRLTAL